VLLKVGLILNYFNTYHCTFVKANTFEKGQDSIPSGRSTIRATTVELVCKKGHDKLTPLLLFSIEVLRA